MIALLIWLAGSCAMVYEMTTRHYWHDALAICATVALLGWVLGGFAMISLRLKRAPAPGNLGTLPRADIERLIATARAREAAASAVPPPGRPAPSAPGVTDAR